MYFLLFIQVTEFFKWHRIFCITLIYPTEYSLQKVLTCLRWEVSSLADTLTLVCQI